MNAWNELGLNVARTVAFGGFLIGWVKGIRYITAPDPPIFCPSCNAKL